MAKKHLVKCKYCGKTFDANVLPYVKPTSNRYAHKQCHEEFLSRQKQEEADKQALFEYIEKLFGGNYNIAGVNTYIKKFREDPYNFSYSGIHKALVYFYEIKGNSLSKANGNIGIVPYVYKDAYNYYYSLWEAKQKNENKEISDFLPVEKTVKIPIPQRKLKKRKLFSFLDEEEGNGE